MKCIYPTADKIKPNTKFDYDAAIFYTGGKDSSFLLYYLSEVLHLRILALTWLIPYMAENALQNIEAAKKLLSNVTFITRKAPDSELRKIYKKVYELQQNTCICPSVVYVLFYKELVDKKVPYLILGEEPAQCRGIIFNKMAPRIMFYPFIQRISLMLMNIVRLITFRYPYKNGQQWMYLVVKNLAFGKSRLLKVFGYRNEIIENTFTALQESPELLKPFAEAVKKSRNNKFIPALVHIDFNDISRDGIYKWDDVKVLLHEKLGWNSNSEKGLHTSCNIENCKEYSQHRRFLKMESAIIPMLAIELAIATGDGNIDRQKAIIELKHNSGFTATPPQETEYINSYLNNMPCFPLGSGFYVQDTNA
ncbi:MAG: hypothetical protein A2Y17_05785 [Clostridiales bacterium GWF2_38_85]|nr:MAG: hypothetical protein A2Y17_05785 [Clostridiales bacterium GWF2_38_85]HBL84007.1 hypothetical protein [Clostridiales bacterium]